MSLPDIYAGSWVFSRFFQIFTGKLVDMKIHRFASFAPCLILVLWCQSSLAADEVTRSPELNLSAPVAYDFVNENSAGLYRKKLSSDFRIRGWEIADSLYFGQAKVGNKWGLGMVFQSGDTAYGINHRGIQVMKRF